MQSQVETAALDVSLKGLFVRPEEYKLKYGDGKTNKLGHKLTTAYNPKNQKQGKMLPFP